jgi:hypothetical protein
LGRSRRHCRRDARSFLRLRLHEQHYAQKIADAQTEKAVIAALTPVCAEKFRALPDVAARTAIIVANKDNPYLMRAAFKDEEALVTLPGKTYPETDLVSACAKLVLAPPKSAAVVK